MPPAESKEPLLSEKEVAPRLGISVNSLRRWRLLSKGPAYVKFGPEPRAAVRYNPRDVERWLASRPIGGDRSGRSR
jgi:predicted DNA-binding transcriptional regulator AlpA